MSAPIEKAAPHSGPKTGRNESCLRTHPKNLKRIAVNRANAQHSTGPRSSQGKAASSMNNFRHGFCGRLTVLETESQPEFDAFLNALREEHQPSTPTEHILVDQM